MLQSLEEENYPQVQRFDTPVIRDLDFPKESGDQPMPGQQAEPAPGTESEPTPITAEQPQEQQPQAAQPVTAEPAPMPQTATPPEAQAPQAADLPAEPDGQSAQQITQAAEPDTKIDPRCIPKYMNQLTKPPVYVSNNSGDDTALYIIDIGEFKQQILPPGYAETTVVGYGGTVMDEETCRFRYYQNAPGATIEAIRNAPISIKWNNNTNGPSQRTSIVTYPNNQETAALWYHGDASGVGLRNGDAGLAGTYLLRGGKELAWRRDSILPRGRYEIPLIIQDRSFNSDGSFSSDPMLLGSMIMVNGKVWPNLDVERRQYRFRLFNGSGTRVYNLRLSNGMPFIRIGDNGGFLPEPVALQRLLLTPGGRADILADFSILPPGTKIILENGADAPFPDGGAPDPETTGQIMQFTIPPDSPEPVKPKKLPNKLTV